jgi:hypothetical protein
MVFGLSDLIAKAMELGIPRGENLQLAGLPVAVDPAAHPPHHPSPPEELDVRASEWSRERS